MTGLLPYKRLIFFLLACCLHLNSLDAQNQRLSKSTHRALNNYIVYSNEVVHALNLMYFDFLHINEQFFLYVEDSIPKVTYKKDNILTNYEYFPVFPRDIYPKILSDNIYIPYDKRGSPLQLIGKVVNVLEEIENTRSLLSNYITTNEYQRDTNLTQGFQWLRRMEVLYYDMFTLQEKLHWNLSSIIQTYEQPLIDTNALIITQELQPLLKQGKLVIKSVRAKDSSKSLAQHIAKLREIITHLEQQKGRLFRTVPIDSNELTSPDRRFDAILLRSKNILKSGREYSNNPQYQNLDFEPHYYYYNINLLDNYNRTGDGIVTLFNKFINHSGVYWLHEHEMPHIFEVRYPNIPAYEQYQKNNFNVDSIIAEALSNKAKADSIAKVREDSIAQVKEDSISYAQHIQDSIEHRKNNPQPGDMNLTGFADNNLIFLLDISSSMSSDSNKLPLLKEALVQLLDLMRPEDKITLITYSGKAQIALPPTLVRTDEDKKNILNAIEGLASSGMSDANQGLKLAYETVEETIIKDGNNRIILATDGAIKVNQRVKGLIKKSNRKNNIQLSVFYFSKKEYTHHKELLQELASTGSGKYSYIQRKNAKKILVIEAQAVRQKGSNNKEKNMSTNKS